MTNQYNFSNRRRLTVLAALVAASWSVVAVAADAVLHLAH